MQRYEKERPVAIYVFSVKFCMSDQFWTSFCWFLRRNFCSFTVKVSFILKVWFRFMLGKITWFSFWFTVGWKSWLLGLKFQILSVQCLGMVWTWFSDFSSQRFWNSLQVFHRVGRNVFSAVPEVRLKLVCNTSIIVCH